MDNNAIDRSAHHHKDPSVWLLFGCVLVEVWTVTASGCFDDFDVQSSPNHPSKQVHFAVAVSHIPFPAHDLGHSLSHTTSGSGQVIVPLKPGTVFTWFARSHTTSIVSDVAIRGIVRVTVPFEPQESA